MNKKTADIMSRNLVTVYETDDLEGAYVKLKMNGIRHFPVLNSNNEVVGVISDRDFQRAMIFYSSETFEFLADEVVADYMTFPIKTVPHDADLLSVVKKMLDHQISSVLISKENNLVGIITHEDLLLVLSDILKSNKAPIVANIENWLYKSPIGDIALKFANAGI